MENVNYILFDGGQQFELAATPTGKAEKVGGIRRDVLSVTIKATHAEALAAFGQPWELHAWEQEKNKEGKLELVEKTYKKTGYTVLASICDNCDGTVTVRVARESTKEEDLQVELEAAQAENSALTEENAAKDAEIESLNTEIDNLVVEILTADAAAAEIEETTETVEEEVTSDEGTTEQTV
ncbi:MAG: hypothetical protein IJ042_01935 [Butyricicoccus sp.]|nr:hypothetical protein [Butyricicoccus sp.]